MTGISAIDLPYKFGTFITFLSPLAGMSVSIQKGLRDGRQFKKYTKTRHEKQQGVADISNNLRAEWYNKDK